MISSSHQCNWLSVEGEERIIIYNHGSVPGDPWADIIFGLLYSKVTTEIRRAVIQMGGEVRVPCAGPGWAASRDPHDREVVAIDVPF
eukprot:64760-Alexandrium_andersonii.AAC.1